MINIDMDGEFGYELVISVPYAYWLHERSELGTTTSSKDTRVLYFFSDSHLEVYEHRLPCLGNSKSFSNASFSYLHSKNPDFSKWKFPDYKSKFKNNVFVYNRPILLISNKRYVNEGNTQKNGFFNDNELEFLFDKFNKDYTIIYNRAKSNKITTDGGVPVDDFSDYELAKKYNVIDINELHDAHSNVYTFNELQFMIHANCENFISVQGGSSILSSAFGGTNIIYAFGGEEIKTDSYRKWYPKFSNCNVQWDSNFDGIRNLIKVYEK